MEETKQFFANNPNFKKAAVRTGGGTAGIAVLYIVANAMGYLAAHGTAWLAACKSATGFASAIKAGKTAQSIYQTAMVGTSFFSKANLAAGFTKISTLFKSVFTFLGAVSPWV